MSSTMLDLAVLSTKFAKVMFLQVCLSIGRGLRGRGRAWQGGIVGGIHGRGGMCGKGVVYGRGHAHPPGQIL